MSKPASTIKVQCGSLVFPGVDRSLELPHGVTVAEAVDALELSPVARAAAVVSIEGAVLPPESWAYVRPKAGKLVSVGICPENIDRNILASAGSVLSILAGNMIPRLLGLGGVPGFIFGAVLQLGGLWAVSTLIGRSPEREERETYTLTGTRNQIRPDEPVPRIFGKLRIYPPLAAQPVTYISGNEQYMSLLFSLGYKPVRVSGWRIGDRELRYYLPMPRLALETGYLGSGDALDQYSGGQDVAEQVIDKALVPLPENSWYADRSREIRNLQFVPHPDTVLFVTQDDAIEASIDLTFPEGLFYIDSTDALQAWRAIFAVRYRPYGATGGDETWTSVPNLDNFAYGTEVRSLVDSDWYAGLVDLRDRLEVFADRLENVLDVERGITNALRSFSANILARIGSDTTTHLANTAIPDADRGVIGDIQTQVDRIADLVDSAATTTETALIQTRDFSDILSASILVLHAVSNYMDLNAYAARGFGEGDLEQLTVLQRWFVNRRNIAGLFGAPPPGHFQIATEQLVEGAFRLTLHWPMLPGKYEVQVMRIELPHGVRDNGAELEIHDDCTLTVARSARAVSPVSDYARGKHGFAALTLRAGVDLANSLDRVSCLVEAPIPWHDGDEWQDAALYDADGGMVYRNPAWAFAHIARQFDGGELIEDRYLDIDTIREAAAYFNQQGYYFDGVFDRARTKQQAMEDVLAVARATPIQNTDGKWTIVYERPQTVTRGFVTPRNARNFSISRNYVPAPHVIWIKYVNAAAGYVEDEMPVYADGYGDPTKTNHTILYFDGGVPYFYVPFITFVDYIEDTVTGVRYAETELSIAFPSGGDPESRIYRFDQATWAEGHRRFRVSLRYTPAAATVEERISTFGMVDAPASTDEGYTGNVYKYGRYLHAVARLRPEVFQAEQDWEHLSYRRGDRVETQYDVTRWGFFTGRVVSAAYTTGGDLLSITLDEAITQATGEPIAVRIRTKTGAVVAAVADDAPGTSNTLYFTENPPDLDGATVEPGDLVPWGIVDNVTTNCIARSFGKQDDLGARVVLIQDHPAIYEADDMLLPEFDPRIVLPPDPAVLSPPVPQIIEVIADERAIVRDSLGRLQSRILVRLALSQGTTDAEAVAARDVDSLIVEYRPHILFAGAYATAPGQAYAIGEDPLQGQVTETHWTRLPAFPAPTDRVYASPVIDGQYYDVRVRALTKLGVPSEWATVTRVYVAGKLTPPPGVVNLRWTDGTLLWDYPARPIDLAGFRVRALYGTTTEGGWDVAAPAHDGLVTDTRFIPSDVYVGSRVFMVRAVDTSGNESVEIARINVILGRIGDALVGNVLERIDHRALGWPGVKENMTGSTGGDLDEDSGTFTYFWRPKGLPAWPNPAGKAWRSDYPGCSYQFDWTAPVSGIEGDVTLIVEATGDEWWIEWRAVDPPMWTNGNFWPSNPAGNVLPASLLWRPFPCKFTPDPGVTYQFRIVAPWNDSGLTITRCELVVDVPDVIEYVNGFIVADSGTVRLPLSKAFRVVTGVQLTIQTDIAPYDNAFTAAIIDRDATGPAIEVYDTSGSRVPGRVDAIIQGY